ncbi:glycoside hydrolase family 43 protein [Sphingomonas arenae]|uniref:glycoside hydrolase family 43 protein n=1 Tax=Sphingomonas arenae TaxID=2812555 RepID=UPI0019683989|nr:glycoside hydrolase family 43 protein [Sphingomonas arenae]
MRTLLVASLLALASAPALSAEPAFVPVFERNFPDPFITEHNGEFIAYSTNDGPNVPMATSRDLVTWAFVMDPADATKKRDAMPTLAPWAKAGSTWAPEVMKVGDHWILYYTAAYRKQNIQCLGAAVARDPKGPFVDTSPEPFLCQRELGGTIDANPFRDRDGKLYLYFKNDGNRVRRPTRLWGVQLSADGLKLQGEPVDLGMTDKDRWEGGVIEAPTMVLTPQGHTMFYSAGFFGWDAKERFSPYAMGYASCQGPLGPCSDAKENPILYSYSDPGSTGCLSGPGHQNIFRANGGTFISFHAWATTRSCRPHRESRYLYIAPFGWENGKPAIAPSLRGK